ncbi:MAG: hypothetical protein JNM82_00260, partial [Rhodocyclaceae bacterium]|nr:hypothetical protein [Rhodocyclaceae bacterium]
MKLKQACLAGSAIALAFASSAANAHEIVYNVTQTYNQVVYDASHPTWDTMFTGSFTYDPHAAPADRVSLLTGDLTQAMTGNAVSRHLGYQLSSVYDAGLGGLLVSVFYKNTTDVFQGGGFATGGMKEYGNQNAYVTIFVNTMDPTAALTQPQIDKLAYGDCTDGSLMGMGMGAKTCMTGWVKYTGGIAGPGGTMRGTFPIEQTITAAVPEPETYALMLAGLGLTG